jgi:hypothetical protein
LPGTRLHQASHFPASIPAQHTPTCIAIVDRESGFPAPEFDCGVHQKQAGLAVDVNQVVASMAAQAPVRPAAQDQGWHTFCIYIVMQLNAAFSSGILVQKNAKIEQILPKTLPISGVMETQC